MMVCLAERESHRALQTGQGFYFIQMTHNGLRSGTGMLKLA